MHRITSKYTYILRCLPFIFSFSS